MGFKEGVSYREYQAKYQRPQESRYGKPRHDSCREHDEECVDDEYKQPQSNQSYR